MTGQKQATKAESKEKSQLAVERIGVKGPAEQSAILAQLADGSTAHSGGDAIQTQAARLGDRRLQRTQRQALAAEIRRVHGNLYLQRAVALTRQDNDAIDSEAIQRQMPPRTTAQDRARPSGRKTPFGELAPMLQHGSVPRWQVISRFEYKEHKTIGDIASEGKWIVLFPGDEKTGVKKYQLPYGDMVALAGDWFKSLDDMRALARSESGQRQIEYARHKCGVVSEPAGVTDDEKKKVTKRYYKLNEDNFHHFARTTTANNNLNSYLKGHSEALDKAFLAGLKGEKKYPAALQIESFYDHFLTDAFTGGHITSPRQAAKEHWEKLCPLFMDNFFDHVAEHMANHIHDSSVLVSVFKTIPGLKSEIFSVVKGQAPPGVSYSLGGLLSVAIHDWYNKRGLEVESKVGPHGKEKEGGHKWTAYGESTSLEETKAKEQREMVIAAVKAGLEDLKKAHECKTAEELKAIGPPYRVQDFVPKVDPSSTKNIDFKWKFDTVDALIGNSEMMAAVRYLVGPEGNIGRMLDVAAEDIGKKPKGEYAQPAFKDWLSRLRGNTGRVIKEIADYVPGGTQHHATTDVLSRDYIAKLKAKGKLSSLSTQQMVGLIDKMLKGATADEDENAIIDVLRAASKDTKVIDVVNTVGFKRIEEDIHGEEWDKLLKVFQDGYFKKMPLSGKIAFVGFLFEEYSTGETGEETCVALLNACGSSQFKGVVKAVGKGELDDYLDGAEQDRFDELVRLHG